MTTRGLTALLVEDNEPDAAYIERLFHEIDWPTIEQAAADVELLHVETVAGCIDELRVKAVDVVLLDLNLPDSTNIETLDAVLEATEEVPVVVLTGLDDEETGVEAVERGAQDYLPKGDVNATLLGRTIRHAIERQRRERELRTRNEELTLLNRLVRHDIRDDMALVRGWGTPLYDHVDQEGRANLDRLLEATTHVIELTDTVGDFLDVLHDREEPALRPVDLQATLDAELEKARSMYERATFRATKGEETVYVRGTELLSSVFRNLLANAVQHNDTDDPTVRIDVIADAERVTVTIADDGPGIPDSRKDAVFGRTADGLADPECSVGLYLVDTLVDLYGGEVTVRDNEPRGCVFEVVLQRADAERPDST